MKKILAMLLAAMMILSLAACGGEPAPTTPAAPTVDSFQNPYKGIEDYDEHLLVRVRQIEIGQELDDSSFVFPEMLLVQSCRKFRAG